MTNLPEAAAMAALLHSYWMHQPPKGSQNSSGLTQGTMTMSAVRSQRAGLQPDQVFRQLVHSIDIGRPPADVYLDIATRSPTDFAKRRRQRRQSCVYGSVALRTSHEHSDVTYVRLRPRRERPHRRAAK
jgi:hypothetical protein